MNSHPTRALIDRGAFLHNLSCVRSYCAGGAKIMAVVKANAYGHGVIELSRAALDGGAAALAVARIDEAFEIRRAGIAAPVLVFELPADSQLGAALGEDLLLTVGSVAGARALSKRAGKERKRALVHVKVDTGMGRLGFNWSTAPGEIESVARLPHLELAGLYSHFATAGEPETSYARLQLERFLGVLDALGRKGIEVPVRHMANSGAIVAMPGAHLDMVRPGIMLYGYMPERGMVERFPVRPVLSLVSSIAHIKTVEEGTSISYGRRYATAGRTVIATIPVGYADGFPRRLTGRAEALLNGKRYPVVGTVCMDHCMLDLGEDSGCATGDEVVLIGTSGKESCTAWDIAEALGTIPYEITCQISSRVSRVTIGHSPRKKGDAAKHL
jgi:alanine racemase